MKLATSNEVYLHRIGDLQATLFDVKAKNTRGKRLNLTGEETTGNAEFYSLTRILQAQIFQETKEAAEQEEIRQKKIRKEERECIRVQKLKEKEDTKIQKIADRQLAKEQKEDKTAKRRAQIKQNKQDRALVK